MEDKKALFNEIKGMASTDGIKAVVQPRIHSSKKTNLEDINNYGFRLLYCYI